MVIFKPVGGGLFSLLQIDQSSEVLVIARLVSLSNTPSCALVINFVVAPTLECSNGRLCVRILPSVYITKFNSVGPQVCIKILSIIFGLCVRFQNVIVLRWRERFNPFVIKSFILRRAGIFLESINNFTLNIMFKSAN